MLLTRPPLYSVLFTSATTSIFTASEFVDGTVVFTEDLGPNSYLHRPSPLQPPAHSASQLPYEWNQDQPTTYAQPSILELSNAGSPSEHPAYYPPEEPHYTVSPSNGDQPAPPSRKTSPRDRACHTQSKSSLSNEHVDDLHEMLCGDDDMNIDASLCDLIDIEFVTFHDNCLDDALCIHDLIAFCLSSISLPEVAAEINVVQRCANYCLSRCCDEALLRQLEAVRPCCKSEQLESIGDTATEQLCYCGTLLRKTALRLAEECLLWKD
nr:hypothetical protein Iba_chr10bCG9490 [Ipomoea batatas]